MTAEKMTEFSSLTCPVCKGEAYNFLLLGQWVSLWWSNQKSLLESKKENQTSSSEGFAGILSESQFVQNLYNPLGFNVQKETGEREK